ncbi:MAG: Ribosomal subunit interface protein [Candidatus Magasanikbacteria bacterium GW2011_GWD2_43_18]|uniref:Ribosomal subunit interface protein n=1 Tax=Candidatus Magasanikbacteria bacterium GW2011_GWE2_42_7 TaxID=1619052 RepID=A0A0G1BGZ4_9BACT|nr:MAG: Ribosomal subunit interface protein [Candidatus Magasanikbacteria bacterium GW2011_GWC2_42_27]KKS72484.1 MAG: Ribosomal subunit interface protein [Candidatus Magasanikbacteria bacterium GW2011_GWE2_42_7]KKT03240.1 MAG: Ribosomal subunit interface protein [Candidatus Magasanikbacteria bacterium GW2011_GWD2_43_18]KKT25286.1 MAG: Ribosomal subunit interface protein [Candidatus Magasanikbacteria bacterium GW2011_GWA2_43_9]HBB38598.1 ribosome-associated translation inhibitor RaiA [Candidatus
MNININFTGIEPTEAIKEYVTEKVESLTTFFDGIESADIDVGMKSHHHQKGKVYFAEFKLQIPGRPSLYLSKEADSLYKAIDKVKDHMKVELEKVKGKMNQLGREDIRGTKQYDVSSETNV